jgi:hypothetical protein
LKTAHHEIDSEAYVDMQRGRVAQSQDLKESIEINGRKSELHNNKAPTWYQSESAKEETNRQGTADCRLHSPQNRSGKK